MKKKLTLLLTAMMVLVMAVFLGACSSSSSSNSTSQSSDASEVTITDATGKVSVATNPKKVVVLDFGVADTLRALGYEDVIVGMPKGSVPTYLSDLTSKDSITDVGNLKEVNLETIANLEPDLIIASGRTSSQLEDFQEIAPTIYFSTDTSDYWNSVQKNVTELAKIFGSSAKKEAKSQLSDIDDLIEETAEKNADTTKTTLMLMLNEGNMSGIAADGRYSFVYEDLGFKATDLEIEESSHGAKDSSSSSSSLSSSSDTSSSSSSSNQYHGSGLSYESISEVNPDIIFVVDRTLAIGGDDSANSDILNNDLIQATNAGQNNKIITLTSDLWYLSGGGLESTKLMIEEVAAYAGN